MHSKNIRDAVRFYFITDENVEGFSPLDQVRTVIAAGATMIQYRNKSFTLDAFGEVVAICRLCKDEGIFFVVNDNVLLAKAVGADGVHVGQDDDAPILARRVLGPDAIVGVSVSTMAELKRTNVRNCDYIGTGPTFSTGTKADAKPVRGLAGLREIVHHSPVPVVAIGGVGPENGGACFECGAAGLAVISCITRAQNPKVAAAALAHVCGVRASLK